LGKLSKTKNKVPERKIKEVETLKNLIANKKTLLMVSIKNIPASQFQEIGKKLRGKAIIKVPKKSLIFRAIDNSDNKEVKKIKEKIDESFALLFSDLDSFELAAELLKSKTPAKAKPGQEAPRDIEIQEGPTELVPGPAISELGALGIEIQIEKGKINIKKSKVIVKEGEKIKQAAADIMAKLDIKPFSIGFTPVAAFDTKENKIYLQINIDPESTIQEFKEAYGKALGFAVNLGIINSETIKVMIAKASAQEKRLNRIMSGEPEEEVKVVEEKPAEEPKEEKKEEGASAAGLSSLFG